IAVRAGHLGLGPGLVDEIVDPGSSFGAISARHSARWAATPATNRQASRPAWRPAATKHVQPATRPLPHSAPYAGRPPPCFPPSEGVPADTRNGRRAFHSGEWPQPVTRVGFVARSVVIRFTLRFTSVGGVSANERNEYWLHTRGGGARRRRFGAPP